MEPLLRVEDLRTYFFTRRGVVRAVDGVDFEVLPGEVLGIVGESGSGKTVTALSVMRLIPRPGRIVGGRVWWDGRDLLGLPEGEMRRLRGRAFTMMSHDPLAALNPVFPVGAQVSDVLRWHRGLGRGEAWREAVALLARVGIAEPYRVAREYPHRLSGGMRQRVLLAMVLACGPRLLIADEPTTALDVTVQAQVLELLGEVRRETGMSMVLITHDLGVIAEMADRVAVLYAGRVVEMAGVRELFRNPLHPYTRELLASVRGVWMAPEPAPPAGSGCPFAPRCPEAVAECREGVPELREVRPGHRVRCLRR